MRNLHALTQQEHTALLLEAAEEINYTLHRVKPSSQLDLHCRVKVLWQQTDVRPSV
jgi:hypothetical protein